MEATQRPNWLPAYIPELQGLRGLAVLAVVVYHCHARLEGTLIHYASLWGWAGVNLFFVLSGFLITSILIEAREKPHYFMNFYARRALRIWPVYLLLLVVCYSVPEWFLGDTLAHQTGWKTLAAYALFLQNLRHHPLPGTLGPTWSLAIEEQYYLLWAPVVFFGRGRPLRWLLPLVLLTMLAASPLVRHLHPHWLTGTHTLIHLDGIALGSLLALALHRFAWERRTWLSIGFAAALAGFSLTATVAGGTSLLDSALALAFGGVVLVCLAGCGANWLAPLRRGPLAYYGKISYGLYMTHILVFVYFGNFDARLDDKYRIGVAGNLAIVALRLAASTLVATALWYGFESQILKLKRYFKSM
jgi:peptidoglycan/LPS O-acetylase OafA/YrhL